MSLFFTHSRKHCLLNSHSTPLDCILKLVTIAVTNFFSKVYKAKPKALAVSHWCPQFSVPEKLTQHFTVLSNHDGIFTKAVFEKLTLKLTERNKIFQHIIVSCYTQLNILNTVWSCMFLSSFTGCTNKYCHVLFLPPRKKLGKRPALQSC